MPRPPVHPGDVLKDELNELGISVLQLSEALHVPNNRLYQILRGERGITADTALRLGHYLGTGADLWLNLQKIYELRLAEQAVGQEIQRTIKPRVHQPSLPDVA